MTILPAPIMSLSGRALAGFRTVTMFLIDSTRDPEGNELVLEMTNLRWGIQTVKLKIQEMIFSGRKTTQCGVILFGSNIVNKNQGDYERVEEYIPIAHPTAETHASLDAIQPTGDAGDDPEQLPGKKWTRNIVMITDGENPIDDTDCRRIVHKLKELEINLTFIGNETSPFDDGDKSPIKVENEAWYTALVDRVNPGRDRVHPEL